MNPPNNQSSASVSVVVPSYNHAPFIEKTLRSVLNQTQRPLELIVIDDGSRDDSPQIIERMLKNCAMRCELIVRGNKGLCATLNEGLARTKGDFFAYLSSDDVWLPTFLEARLKLLETRPAAVLAYGNAYSIDELNNVLDCTCDWASYTDGNAQEGLFARGLAPMSPTVVYRRAALERYGWNEASKLEDYELYLRLSADGEFAFDPQVLSAWRVHSYNTSRDLEFMATEWLAAQSRVGTQIGLDSRRLAALQTSLKWKCAEDFMRAGQKRRALDLVLHNMRGTPSGASLARLLAGLLIPHSIRQRRRLIMQQQARKRYEHVRI
ncbi:MAG: glycosyltransferase family A protein [Pyrinomonadaceae bacterium]